MSAPTHDLDWGSAALCRRRQQKSRAAWLALRKVLAARGSEAAEPELADFLDGGRFVDAASEASAARVLEDPAFYHWVRIAFDLFAARRTGTAPPPLASAFARAAGAADAESALRAALAAWKRFALAVALADSAALRFRTPLLLRGASALPGHALVLEATGTQAILGCDAGMLERADGTRLPFQPGAALPGLALRACPVVRVGALEVRMSPALFGVPGGLADLPDTETQWAWQPLLEAGLHEVARVVPETFAELAAALRVVAMKPYLASDFANQTLSHLPGASVLSAVPHVPDLADKLIHEWAHDRLFALEEGGPFLAEDDPAAPGIYSPWRDDLRPAQGLLHAIYVHVQVWPFWERLLAAGAVPEGLAELSRDRLVRYALQLALGLRQLHRHARLTPRGELLAAELARGAEAAARACERLGLGPELPARVVALDGEVVPERGERGQPLTLGAALDWHRRRALGDAGAAEARA